MRQDDRVPGSFVALSDVGILSPDRNPSVHDSPVPAP